jgi:hypothetical protein
LASAGGGSEAAQRALLHAVGERPEEQGTGQPRRGRGAAERDPHLLEGGRVERGQARNVACQITTTAARREGPTWRFCL